MHLSKVVFASNNLGKVKEIQKIASLQNWQIIPQSDFQTPDIEETGLSFIENAILKARNGAKHSGLPTLADDSGLEVLALNGEPGIYSARFSGKNATDASNNALLLEKLKDIPADKRQANFRCCLALLRHEHDPCPIIGEGIWQGSIAFDAQGEFGFGYDPLFIVSDLKKRSAELVPELKNQISHRALAFQDLFQRLKALHA